MKFIIPLEIVLSLLLSVIILVQQQGTGLGGAFGGEGNVYRSKRGFEKFLFFGTIVVAVAFFSVAAVYIVKSK